MHLEANIFKTSHCDALTNACFWRAFPSKDNSSFASAEGASRKILRFLAQKSQRKDLDIHERRRRRERKILGFFGVTFPKIDQFWLKEKVCHLQFKTPQKNPHANKLFSSAVSHNRHNVQVIFGSTEGATEKK